MKAAGNRGRGRPKGSPNKITAEIAKAYQAKPAKDRPLDVILELMSDYRARYKRLYSKLLSAAPDGMIDLADEKVVKLINRLHTLAEMTVKFAKEAAPYAHPRLIATWDHEGGFPEDFDFGRLNSRQLGQLIEQISENQESDRSVN